MKTRIFLIIAVFSLGLNIVGAQSHYRAPDHNFSQNNWMSGQ